MGSLIVVAEGVVNAHEQMCAQIALSSRKFTNHVISPPHEYLWLVHYVQVNFPLHMNFVMTGRIVKHHGLLNTHYEYYSLLFVYSPLLERED